jgi:hypothetical protein
LQADAVGSAERIYDFAGLVLENEVRTAMKKWATVNPPGSRGEHRYSPAEFGLTAGEIRRAFSEYLDRYGDLCHARAG